ncbi:hypothetical protein DL93DRAFT_389227 [Clavulina sp. PMI_390]|nr:hypothetical protein DL93DRAFT_389227 [Clavulina sp. PMI_390]
MIRKGVFPIENNSINPLPRGASTSATGTTPPAPLVAQTASSTGPLITPADSSASSAPVISQAPIHAVVSAVPAVPPMNDPSIVVNEAPALTTNDTESPTSARVRPENTRAMIGVDTSMPIPIIAPLIDFTSVTPTGLQLPQIIPAPQAPLSGIPTDEQGALISPIMPVQAPTSSTIPTIADTPSIALPGSITMAAPPPSIAPASIPAPPQPVSAPAASAHTTVSRVCRECALEMFLHEIYPWWARERARVLANMAAAAAAPPPPPPVVSVPVAQDGTDAVVADSSMEAPQSSAVDPAITEAEQHETQSNAAPQATDAVQDGDGGDDSDDDEGYVGESQASGSNDAISMLPSSSSMMVKLPDWVARADCPEGRHCERQKERAHAKECELNFRFCFQRVVRPGTKRLSLFAS